MSRGGPIASILLSVREWRKSESICISEPIWSGWASLGARLIDANLESSQSGGTRRILAVLMSDVYGFTSAVGHQEEFAVSRVKEDLNDFAQIVVAHSGRVVADRGDGVKAVFDSGVDALRAALKMQSLILQKNSKVGPDGLRVRHRIGIHVGDVIISGDRYTGLAVAIAARLESLCPPGKVAFTDTVHEMTRQTLHFDRSFMGQYEVKNVEHPVRVWVGRIPGDLESISMPTSAVVAGTRKEIVIQQKSHDGFWRAITVVILLMVVAAAGVFLRKMYLDSEAKGPQLVLPQGSTGTATRSRSNRINDNTPKASNSEKGGSGAQSKGGSPAGRGKANSPAGKVGPAVSPPAEKPKVDPNAPTDEETLKEIYNLPGKEKKNDETPAPEPGGGAPNDPSGQGEDVNTEVGGASHP